MRNVRLKCIKYSERVGHPKEWTLEGLTLWPINLLVGRNATGKSRALAIIWSLAKLFTPDALFRVQNCGYELDFDNDGQPFRYILRVEDGKVTQEEVHAGGGEQPLIRGPGGEGKILTQTEGKRIPFRPPENELAAVARRDSLQHPFLEPLHEWALGVRYYTFGSHLGKDHVIIPVQGGPEPDDRNPDQVVGIFRKGVKELGPDFVQAVRQDMVQIGYDIEDISTHAPENIRILHGGSVSEVLVLGIREGGIQGVVDQNDMSQGMFRALSVLIQVNYSQMARRANCILIDDIGEGLDFQRSEKLIKLLRSKAQQSSFQLIMSTNDQFVMNHVPLEEWSVLKRDGCHVRVYNHENAKEQFEYFHFVGMSNFTFFEMDFVNGSGKMEKALAHE